MGWVGLICSNAGQRRRTVIIKLLQNYSAALGACKITNSLIFWLSSIFTSYYLTPGLVCLNLSMVEWMEMANCHREAAERRAGKRNRVEEGHSGEWIYQREGMEEGWAGGWFQ